MMMGKGITEEKKGEEESYIAKAKDRRLAGLTPLGAVVLSYRSVS
jgi:hypothetical protein